MAGVTAVPMGKCFSTSGGVGLLPKLFYLGGGFALLSGTGFRKGGGFILLSNCDDLPLALLDSSCPLSLIETNQNKFN